MVGLGTAVNWSRAGLILPIVKEVTKRGLLVLFELSVTVMVQLSWVPSARALKVIVLLEAVAAVVELLQPPAYAMVPAWSELKV